MVIDLALLAASANGVFAATGSPSGDFNNFGVIFLASGFVLYAVVYFRYRNTNKRHRHELETEASLHNLREQDQRIRSLKGLSEPRIAGENGKEVRGALRRFF